MCVLYSYHTYWVYIGCLDTYKYTGNPDGNLSCIFLAKRTREMEPGFKGCRRGTGAKKKGALHTHSRLTS